jgi:biopolymer transport protein ExbD
MAIGVNGGVNGSRRRRGEMGALSEINVTPFVDVVLVLLVIFMLTAHVMEFGLKIDAPEVKYVQDTAQDLPVVGITKDGTTYLNERPVNINDLKTEIQKRFGSGKAVFVKADKETIWEVIAQVTAELGASGFQINMVTKPQESVRGRKK